MATSKALNNHGSDGLAILAFKVGQLQFDLNRDLQFISMKDQLIRGHTLILAAHEAGLIGPPTPATRGSANVAIIGGGIGGVSAALMACQLGLSVKLIEAAHECFPLLGMGSDRLFSATVYDWPHEHSGSHAFPFMSPLRDDRIATALRRDAVRLSFPSRAMVGKDLRKIFLDQLSVHQATFGSKLDVLCQHRLGSMDDIFANDTSGKVRLDLQGPSGTRPLTAQIVVFALGFGLDKRNEQTLAARDFFSYAGLNADLRKARAGRGIVRIAGAGDGGLQEALRFVLGDLWHDLHRCVSELELLVTRGDHAAHWAQMCGRIQSAEDQATRSLMWGYSDVEIYRELDRLYQQEITLLLKLAPAEIEAWRQRVVRAADLEVQLVDASSFSKKVYGLNRWLVGLLIRLSGRPSGGARLIRLKPKDVVGTADVSLQRRGFAAGQNQQQIGTVGKEDLLRRLAFQGIPMNLDAVV